ncbi:deoxyribose-phosphate aldolase [Hyunsoonleella sp. SJ7]|uniref:Deoxyribose-phosphate aldolase n=1 Tax=Hyunsoonleella aquatilis TaxID=2762758 RepID=A0A923KMB8_9FLAO|nr:deoxyribose-phosphate aldolase [Hyunsoonleella aquatilis]MBC3759623.1 deoxyribose-phosphate aldolase [Hyunsoonleella aquatilis]
MNIAQYIDYTCLNPSATEHDIVELCKQAIEHNFHSVCVNSCYVAMAKQILKDSNTKVCTVVGFPFGSADSKAKVFEAENAINDGADEIDMVLNRGFLKSKNYVAVLRDVLNVKTAIGKKPLKVILEISELNKNDIIKACEICLDANADYIKTSTGFAKSGATFTAVKIIKKTVKNKMKIKASGGISDFETALKFIDAGADRIGTSTLIKSLYNARQIRNTRIFKQYIQTIENTDSNEQQQNQESTETSKISKN